MPVLFFVENSSMHLFKVEIGRIGYGSDKINNNKSQEPCVIQSLKDNHGIELLY